MGLLNDIVQGLKTIKEYADTSTNKPMIFINSSFTDDHAIEFFKNENVIVVTSTGEKYYHGEKML